MIKDYIENIINYRELNKVAAEIEAFINKDREKHFPDGRYEIDGDNIFVFISTYSPGKADESALYEAHKKYCDLQYIAEGSESIYVADIENLTLKEDRTPENDILFYEKDDLNKVHKLYAGMFGYYTPRDAHMPGKELESSTVRKLVFKILDTK